MKITGETKDGKQTATNVFDMYSTHGMPLGNIMIMNMLKNLGQDPKNVNEKMEKSIRRFL